MRISDDGSASSLIPWDARRGGIRRLVQPPGRARRGARRARPACLHAPPGAWTLSWPWPPGELAARQAHASPPLGCHLMAGHRPVWRGHPDAGGQPRDGRALAMGLRDGRCSGGVAAAGHQHDRAPCRCRARRGRATCSAGCGEQRTCPPDGAGTCVAGRRTGAGQPQRIGARGATQARMRQHWDGEVMAGRIPTGAALNRAAGKDPNYSLGKRYAATWRAELDGASDDDR